MVWTKFWDMHSGGDQKLDYGFIYIEAPKEAAGKVFMHRFGRNPNNITCSCCGEDYSWDYEDDNLQQVSAFHRNCHYDEEKRQYTEQSNRYNKLIPYQEWLSKAGIPGKGAHLIIYAKDIKLEELKGETPRRGHLEWIED